MWLRIATNSVIIELNVSFCFLISEISIVYSSVGQIRVILSIGAIMTELLLLIMNPISYIAISNTTEMIIFQSFSIPEY